MSLIGNMIRQLGRVTGADDLGEKIASGLEDAGHGATTAIAGMTAGQVAASTKLPSLAASNPVDMSRAELCTPSVTAFSSSVAQQLPPPQRSEGMERGGR